MFPGALLAMRYELVRPLGRGGMGQVWLALDRVLGREVAIKTVDVDGTGDATVAERFRREGQAAASLAHEHVVTVFDSGTDAGIAFLVMQLLPGPTVADLLQRGEPLPLEQAVTIAEQTAAALAAVVARFAAGTGPVAVDASLVVDVLGLQPLQVAEPLGGCRRGLARQGDALDRERHLDGALDGDRVALAAA